jgi:hypothetical protein
MKALRGFAVLACCFAVVLALGLVSPLSTVAQTTNGVFTGTVTDQTGAVVPQADVKVTNLGTALVVTAKTDNGGLFRVQELPIGQYKIEASAKGFKTSLRNFLTLNAGTIQRVDFQLQLGESKQVVTVEGGAPLVNTEDFKLALTVTGSQVANLPLNGRNIYDLMQLAPGAVDVTGVMFENGHGTVVNGLRENFNGFLLNGVSNKGLSGGPDTVVNPDIVQEFQQLTLNMSAQYGNSASSITNVVTKSGTNEFHGDVYEFLRNDKLDANGFFINQNGDPRPALRFNQFGAAANGPVIKDKLFFTASYQGDRFISGAPGVPITVESSSWRQAVIAANTANSASVAALLYKDFPPSTAGTPISAANSGTLDAFVSNKGIGNFWGYMCPEVLNGGPAGFLPKAAVIATRFQNLFGVNAGDVASLIGTHLVGLVPTPNCPTYFGTGGPALRAGAIAGFGGRTMGLFNSATASFNTQTKGNLANGNEWSTRLDWVPGQNDRIFGEIYWQKFNDSVGPSNNSSGPRGFLNPQQIYIPNFQFSYVHVFNPRWVNDFRFGFVRNRNDILTTTPGVPSIGFGDGSAGFGSYNGYPQLFRENVYTYSDMISANKGKHSLKIGADFRRNLENSEFNVARPSYYFFDQLFFAVDAPVEEIAGVDPGIITGKPAQLSSNIRHWRNLEFGAYFQDDWKLRRNLTVSLGIRYDLFSRHTERAGQVTTFIPGPGSLIPGNGFFLDGIKNANIPAGAPGCSAATGQNTALAPLAGICGSGGFAAAKNLGKGNYKNFGPRIGVAWDPFGDGKMSVRGGWGISYEGTLYNPLSNSRWNLPFYSFNDSLNFLGGDVNNIIYGPQTPGVAASFTGAPTNPGQGVGAQANGNLSGWDATNSNLAFLTGIVFPEGIRDPRIQNWFVGIQREVFSGTVLEVDYVGTRGRNLFRAENANRLPGGRLPPGTCVNVQGRQECSLRTAFNPVGRLNPNYGTLRVWDNVSRSWYNGLQSSLRRQMGKGVVFSVNYTWSHSIDTGSDWHSGATSANGSAAGDGYSLDQTRPLLDRGNSTFDIRHRIVGNYVWDLPWYKDQHGFIGHVLGGWQYNGIWSYQSGAHWTPYTASSRGLTGACNTNLADPACVNNGGDFNLDSIGNDRPDATHGNSITGNKQMYANGYFSPTGTFHRAYCSPLSIANLTCTAPFFGTPCVGCNGNLGRNTFVGPAHFNTDQSIFKNIKITERFKAQFRAEFFNAFNHANFKLPSSSTGANFANRITSLNFGQSAGTLDPREIQFGLKIFW